MSNDEYTPTTEQVCIVWVERTRSAAVGTSRADQEAAFDRWLAARDAEVAERIAQVIREVAAKAPVMSHENGYPVQAVPKAELLDLAARIAREAGRA